MKLKTELSTLLKQPRLMLGILYLILVSLIAVISGFRGLYGQDSYAYLLYCKQFSQYFTEGQLSLDFQWPVMYPLTGALLASIVSGEHQALLLLSLLSFGVTILVCYTVLKRTYPGDSLTLLVYLFLFLICSPFLIRSSLCVMSESMATAFCMLAFYQLWSSQERYRLLYFTIWASLAVCTRYVMGVLLLFPFFYLMVRDLKSKNYYSYLPALFSAVLIFGIEWYFRGAGFSAFYKNDWLQSWSFTHFFADSFFNKDGWQVFMVPNLLQVFSVLCHPGFIFCGLLFLIFLKFREFSAPGYVVIISVFFYLFFLAGLPTQSQRFLLPVVPLLLLIYYPAFLRLWSRKSLQAYHSLLVVFVFLVQAALIYRALLPFVKRENMERTVATYMRQLKPQRLLYTSGLEGALQVYGVMLPRKSLYVEEYTNFERPSYVLVNPPELEKQWRGTYPYTNWKKMSEKYHLVKIKELEGSWTVYELR